MAIEEVGDPFDNAGSVDQLTLEILHDIQEMVVNLWLVLKLYFDSIKIAKRIGHIQWSLGRWDNWRKYG
jgi:hypothetical protein